MVRKDLLDDLDRRILAELEKDARASNRAIARHLGVSAPTVAHRIRRMEDVGVIRGYRVDLAVLSGAPAPLALMGVHCAECTNPIHGPARTRRFQGKSYAFCCPRCEATFGERVDRLKQGTKGMGVAVVLLGWVATFGILGATCMGMGNCLGPGLAPPPTSPCPPGARGRDEFEETVLPQAAGIGLFRPLGWNAMVGYEVRRGSNSDPGD